MTRGIKTLSLAPVSQLPIMKMKGPHDKQQEHPSVFPPLTSCASIKPSLHSLPVRPSSLPSTLFLCAHQAFPLLSSYVSIGLPQSVSPRPSQPLSHCSYQDINFSMLLPSNIPILSAPITQMSDFVRLLRTMRVSYHKGTGPFPRIVPYPVSMRPWL